MKYRKTTKWAEQLRTWNIYINNYRSNLSHDWLNLALCVNKVGVVCYAAYLKLS